MRRAGLGLNAGIFCDISSLARARIRGQFGPKAPVGMFEMCSSTGTVAVRGAGMPMVVLNHVKEIRSVHVFAHRTFFRVPRAFIFDSFA